MSGFPTGSTWTAGSPSSQDCSSISIRTWCDRRLLLKQRLRTRLAHRVESTGITDIRKGVLETIPTGSGNGVRIGKAASDRRVDHPFRGTPNQKVIR